MTIVIVGKAHMSATKQRLWFVHNHGAL